MTQRQSEFEISDPEEVSQKTRVKEILERRTGLVDTRNASKEAWISGEINLQQAVLVYQTQIEGIILDLWTKFQDKDTDNGKEYLESKEIDTVIIPPPMADLPDSGNDFAAGESLPEAKHEHINGLKWFINNEPVIQKPFTVSTWNPPGEQTVYNQKVLDFETLDKAVQMIMKFIDETGIDASLEEDDTPIIRDFDQSGGKNEGELDKTEYSGDPDI
jgi:hypothetical protein